MNLLLAALLIVLAFIALNYEAYDGYFQDDELDTMSWAPRLGVDHYLPMFAKPVFDRYNFRPTGHLYFTLLSKAFGLDFPPYITPLFAAHLINGALLFFLLRRVGLPDLTAMCGTAIFVLSGSAMDAYWKPMYVFDLLCTTFCLASILLWSHRWWVLSFVAYWLAYKAKELAVMLPLVLLAWEYWLGDSTEGNKRYKRLIPFFVTSLSFGLQGLFLNPNKNNDYTFRFSLNALKKTIPFYERRFLLFRGGSLLLLPLLFVKDRRVWFGLTGMLAFLSLLLFLPGRRFEAYTYLPLALVTIAITAAATRVPRAWAAGVLLLWLPWNALRVHREQREVLRQDDVAFAFVDSLETWIRQHPSIRVLVYEGMPGEYHRWGVTGIWNILHNNANGMQALSLDTAEGREALASQPVGYVQWDSVARKAAISIHSPLPLDPQVPAPR